jgi:phycocyanobilin:ferredoxin oxidoreductase
MNPAHDEPRALLDALANQALTSLDALGLDTVALPLDLQLEADWAGAPLSIRPWARRGPQSPLARVVRVDGRDAVQVLNIVIFPARHIPLPVFGCELLMFRRGVHLFVLDAFDLTPPPRHDCAHHLASLKQRLFDEHALENEQIPAWGRDVFSPNLLLYKPGARRAMPLEPFIPAVLSLLNMWCTSAAHQQPCPHIDQLTPRAGYLRAHGHEEPAGPFLERIAGPAWTERFIFDLLYPRWLYDGDHQPPWSSPADSTLTQSA